MGVAIDKLLESRRFEAGGDPSAAEAIATITQHDTLFTLQGKTGQTGRSSQDTHARGQTRHLA